MLSHLLLPRSALYRRFPSHALTAIEEAIEASETKHRAEIRVTIEVALDLKDLLRLKTTRERALELFAELGVWNTNERNGVLIYVLLADHRVEIVADRGLDRHVEQEEWEAIAKVIDDHFRERRFEAGAVAGVHAVSALLERHFPAQGADRNELGDRPVLI